MKTLRARNSGSGESGWQRPAFFEAIRNGASHKAEPLIPVSNGERFSVMGQEHAVGSIATLLSRSGPAAILRRVMAVIINAVKLMLGRCATSHVGKEIVEGHPAITDRDAATTIPGILGTFRIKAAGFHGAPDVVFRRVCAPMPQPIVLAKMPNAFHVSAGCFRMETAARFNVTVAHIAYHDNRFASAFTATFHASFPSWRTTDDSFNGQATGLKSNKLRISEALHCWLRYHTRIRLGNEECALL